MKTMKFFAILMVCLFGIQFTYAQTAADSQNAALQRKLEMIKGKGMLANAAYETPCTVYDDDNWYTAFNQKKGKEGDPQLANSLLRTCQEQLKSKLAGRVQQITTAYFDQMDINGKSSEAEHIEGASQMMVDQMVNETREDCRRELPDVDANDGTIIMYMSIRISKQEMLKAMEKGIQKDAEAKVRFNEQQFREAAFKVFDQK